MSNETMEILGLDELEVENTPVDDIDSENINLIFFGDDCSGSMSVYEREMNSAITEFKSSLENSKEADEILIARADFADYINIGGYKKISELDTSYSASSATRLYDVICEGAEKLTEYMTFLRNQGMRVKAVFSIFSDGEDTASRKTLADAKNAVAELNRNEITTAFYSFGGQSEAIAKTMGFKNILPTGSSPTELRRGFDCLSKSIIEASKSVVATTDNFFVM